MDENTKKMKVCKHCKTEIDAKAKVCPNCRKKQGGNGKFIAIAIVAVLIIFAAVNGGDDSSEDVASNNASSSKVSTSDTAKSESSKETKKEKEEKETPKPIEYTAYDVSEMMTDLNKNALKAESKYSDQYLEVTGKLSTIDSKGKYISLLPSDDEFAFIGVQCYIESDEQKEKVMEMSTGDIVTVKGKIFSVGEIMGYSLNIDEIK